MTTTTVFADTGDGRLFSTNAVYATCAAGSGLTASTTGTAENVGQNVSAFTIIQLFFSFDTSGIGAETVSQVDFSLFGDTDRSTTDFIATVLAYDWSAGGLTTADWQTPVQLLALTSLATFNSSGFSAIAYNLFTSAGAAFNSAINKTGTTYFMVASSRNISATQPTTDERLQVVMADTSGTASDPKLVITSAAAGQPFAKRVGGVPFMALNRGVW